MDLSLLNSEQKEAVLYNDGPLLIIAGAGSGKTRVITYKVAYLIEQNINPNNILAITFTNKASNEMKERIFEMVGDKAKSILISTFHKFCGRVLRGYIERIGFEKNFTIYDNEDQKKLITNILKDLGYIDKKIKPKTLINKFSYYKNNNISKEEILKEAKSENEKICAACFEEYDKRMFKNNAVDFDDMLLLTVKILKENEDIRKNLSNQFKYILVDEYQDTNLVQFEIIRLLTMDKNNFLTVVGDDDQSIYKFRGADIRNILQFEENYENVKVIKLTQNYRSTNNILKCANEVIKNNQGRKSKELWSNNGDGEKVKYNEYEDDVKEAYSIVNEIKKDNDYKNTAILYRANSQSRRIEEMCVSLSIPYTIVGGVRFYQRKEIKDILGYLHILVNPNDSNSLFRIINVPKRGIGDSTINKIIEYSNNHNISPFNTLLEIDNLEISDNLKKKIKNFIFMILELKNENEIDDLIRKILKKGYEDYLYDEYDEEEAKDRLNNIFELINKANTFKYIYPTLLEDENAKNAAKNLSAKTILEEFLYDIALVADIDNLDDSENKITLMTIHSSKGLEYDKIYIVGMSEGIFPSFQIYNSNDTNEIEEERRLCYVGMTRAKKNLYLSSSIRSMRNGQYYNCEVSRFVNEAEGDFIEKNRIKTKLYDDSLLNNDFWGYNNRKNANFPLKTVDFLENSSNTKISVKDTLNTYKTGLDIVKLSKLDYNIGDTVSHVKFGEGKVIDIEDIGKDYEVTVDFIDIGKKTLFATFAKLKKI